jgi:hypothetical protein
MTRRVYGAAGGTGRVLACVRGPPRRQPRCARRRSHRGGPTTCRPSRGDARRPPPVQHLSAPHRSDIYIERYAKLLHYALRSRDPRRAIGPSKQHKARSVQVDGGNLPAANGDFYVRSPGTRLARYSSLRSDGEMSSNAPSTADKRYR